MNNFWGNLYISDHGGGTLANIETWYLNIPLIKDHQNSPTDANEDIYLPYFTKAILEYIQSEMRKITSAEEIILRELTIIIPVTPCTF